ncbi:vitamin b12 abc transporter, b12-binding component btuf [hydrocarbon metagenome]|jgi:ABC-type Fe3+-hydroxamate transport system, periplasmic component|uniref:Vitamin b12 abc transporter, b12-binding component btuf n=2 Tax=root TaxID=1 RepID=A0A0W8FCL5_9ZZZZ|nr:ABC transporter substrate-binding protein [Methanothrix sp.]MBP7069287.1 ABC transporter substrate-binding protein [Methanothrix sp.]
MTAHRIDEGIYHPKDLEDREISRAAPSPPGRIVSLTPIASELICIFGCIDRIVGRDDHSTFPPALGEKPAVGSGVYRTISAKRVLDLDPDIVVTGRRVPQEEFEKIGSAGVPVVVIGTGCELEALITNILTLGKRMAAEKKAGELVDFLERYANLIRDRTGDLNIEGKPRVYNECAFRRYITKTCTTADEVISIAGGTNIAPDEDLGRLEVSGEWVIRSNPDVILSQVSSTSPATVEMLLSKRDEILSRPELKGTNAIRNGRVYISHLSIRRGPRMVGYLLYLAKWFHPELFQDIDPAAVEKDMLQKFYGLDLEGVWAYPEV